MPLASSVASVIFGLIIIGGLLSLAVVCAMKGKWVFFVLGWFSGIFWIIGASRLGKPNSYWARRKYQDLELAEARRRFSRRPFPRWGGSPWRTGVDNPEPASDPPNTDLDGMG